MTTNKYSELLDDIDLFAAINDDIYNMSGEALLASVSTGVTAFMELHYQAAHIPGVSPEAVIDAVVPAVAQMLIDQARWYRQLAHSLCAPLPPRPAKKER
jgi:predicted signal transduction protein with EAL and GGDEF domain